MTSLPAICDNCGCIFASGFGGSGTFIGCKSGPCPSCGGFGSVPDGTYEVAGDVIRLLIGSHQSYQQLRAVANAVEMARRNVDNAQSAIQDLKRSAPELSSIADSLPKTRNELYAFLTLIITAIGVLIAAATFLTGKSPSEADIQKMIDDTLEESTKRTQAPSAFNSPIRTATKVGRNEKCPCGSGNKFKRCCLMRNSI